MEPRREYGIFITVNDRKITKVIIDSHYQAKHQSSINDEIILGLVRLLNKGTFPVQDKNGSFEYFVTDLLQLGSKTYKLVWLLENDQMYIGVVNAYRRK